MMHDSSCGCPDCMSFHPDRFRNVNRSTMSGETLEERVRTRQGAFDRWYIFHPTREGLAWSGSRWVPAMSNGLPAGDVQISNFDTEAAALAYTEQEKETSDFTRELHPEDEVPTSEGFNWWDETGQDHDYE